MERCAKEAALAEAQGSRLDEQNARDVICAAMDEAEAARNFAIAADERADAAVARANACEVYADAATLAAGPGGHPADRAFALMPELTTPQIDYFDASRLWRDLTPQFLTVEGVGPEIPLATTTALITNPRCLCLR